MNTTEKIVEAYYRLCKKCFTYPDVKVIGGNNRQLDLLAYNLREGSQYHVETSVTHELSGRATWTNLESKFNGTFFGGCPWLGQCVLPAHTLHVVRRKIHPAVRRS